MGGQHVQIVTQESIRVKWGKPIAAIVTRVSSWPHPVSQRVICVSKGVTLRKKGRQYVLIAVLEKASRPLVHNLVMTAQRENI
jgi:hypothetical protein